MTLTCPHNHVDPASLPSPAHREEGTCRSCGAFVWRVPAGRWRTDERAEIARRSDVMAESQRHWMKGHAADRT